MRQPSLKSLFIIFILVQKPHPSYSPLKYRYIVVALGIEMHRGHSWDGKRRPRRRQFLIDTC